MLPQPEREPTMKEPSSEDVHVRPLVPNNNISSKKRISSRQRRSSAPIVCSSYASKYLNESGLADEEDPDFSIKMQEETIKSASISDLSSAVYLQELAKSTTSMKNLGPSDHKGDSKSQRHSRRSRSRSSLRVGRQDDNSRRQVSRSTTHPNRENGGGKSKRRGRSSTDLEKRHRSKDRAEEKNKNNNEKEIEKKARKHRKSKSFDHSLDISELGRESRTEEKAPTSHEKRRDSGGRGVSTSRHQRNKKGEKEQEMDASMSKHGHRSTSTRPRRRTSSINSNQKQLEEGTEVQVPVSETKLEEVKHKKAEEDTTSDAKSIRGAGTSPRRKTIATTHTTKKGSNDDKKHDTTTKNSKDKQKVSSESESRHSRRETRLISKRRSRAVGPAETEQSNSKKDQDASVAAATSPLSKGRIRKSKSQEWAIKKKELRKTKSMDERKGISVTTTAAAAMDDVDADDDTVVANNRAAMDSSPSPSGRNHGSSSRRARSRHSGSYTTPNTNRRVTRRRASLTESVSNAIMMANATTTTTSEEGATTTTTTSSPQAVASTPTTSKRTSRQRLPGRSPSSATPPSTRKAGGRRTSALVGGHQLRQALQQEPKLIPEMLKNLKHNDNIKAKSKSEPERDNTKQQQQERMKRTTVDQEDTDTETDASEHELNAMRLPTSYQQNQNGISLTMASVMDRSGSHHGSLETRSRRSASDRLSSTSYHGRSSSVSATTAAAMLSSSCHEPRSSVKGGLPTGSGHGSKTTKRAPSSSRLSSSNRPSQDSLTSSSFHGPVRSSISSLLNKMELLPSSSDHGGRGHQQNNKSWFSFSPSSSTSKQASSNPLDMPSSSDHRPNKRATSPSRRAAMQRRVSTATDLDVSSSKRLEAYQNSFASKSNEPKASLGLRKDLDDISDSSDDDFAY